MRMIKLTMTLILISLIIPIATQIQLSQAGNHSSILVLYNNQQDRISVDSLFVDFAGSLSIDYQLISNLPTISLDLYSYILFVSTLEFETSEEDEIKLMNFITRGDTTFVTISPYFDEFDDTLETLIGIDNESDIFPNEANVDWVIEIDQSIGQLNGGDRFNYAGEVRTFSKVSSFNTIASVISGDSLDDDIDDLDYPLPVIISSSNQRSQIITAAIGSYEVSQPLSIVLNQIPDLFVNLLREIIASSVENHTAMIDFENTNQTTETSQPIENGNDPVLTPFNIDARIYLLALFVMIIVFFKQILSILRWLYERFWAVSIGVIGAFYNVQDRILDDNDILMNQSRVEILDYLEFMGKYGAHLREIKNVTKMGSGSLLWHLQVLEEFNWINKHKVGKNTVFVATDFHDQFDFELKEIELSLQSKHVRPILNSLVALEGKQINISDLEEMTDIGRKAIRRLVIKLYHEEIIDYISEKPIVLKITDLKVLKLLLDSFDKRFTYSPVRSAVNIQPAE